MKKTTLLINLVLFLTLCTICFFYRPHIDKINLEIIKNSNSRYILVPETPEDYGKYPIYYPYVSINPLSTKYGILPIYENYQIITGQKDFLFFASKRIREIETWKNHLIILNYIQDVKKLRTWWNNQSSISLSFFSNKYSSWESILARYLELMDKDLNIISDLPDGTLKKDKMNDFRKHVYQHKNRIKEILVEATIYNKEKEYLQNLTGSIFSYLYQKSDLKTYSANDTNIYSIQAIKKNSDYGYYQIYFDNNDIVPLDPKTSVLNVNGKSYKVDNASLQYKDITVFNVDIINTSSIITFAIPTYATSNLSWQEFKNKSIGNHKYYTDISQVIPFGKSLITVHHSLGKEAVLMLDVLKYKDISRKAEFQLEGIEDDQNSSFEIDRSRNNLNYFFLIVESKKPIDKNLFSTIQVETKLKTHPMLFSEKKKNLIEPKLEYIKMSDNIIVNVGNISVEQKNILLNSIGYEYSIKKIINLQAGKYEIVLVPWIKNLLFYLLLIVGFINAFLLFLAFNSSFNPSLKQLGVIFFSYLSSIKIVIRKVVDFSLIKKTQNLVIILSAKRIRFVLFFSCITILLDVFVLKGGFDGIKVGILILFYLITLVRREFIKIFFLFALFCLLLALLLYIAHRESFNIASEWAFAFIIVGLIRMIK